MARMDSIALQRRPSRQPFAPPPAPLRHGIAAVLAIVLMVVAWQGLSPLPHQGVGVHRAGSAVLSAKSAVIGDLVRWCVAGGGERLLVANGERDAVIAYDAQTGRPLATTTAGRFAGISGLAIDDSRLYVSEQAAGRVQVLSLPDLHTIAVLPLDAAPTRKDSSDGFAAAAR